MVTKGLYAFSESQNFKEDVRRLEQAWRRTTWVIRDLKTITDRFFLFFPQITRKKVQISSTAIYTGKKLLIREHSNIAGKRLCRCND